jgi:hypothetical protein
MYILNIPARGSSSLAGRRQQIGRFLQIWQAPIGYRTNAVVVATRRHKESQRAWHNIGYTAERNIENGSEERGAKMA